MYLMAGSTRLVTRESVIRGNAGIGGASIFAFSTMLVVDFDFFKLLTSLVARLMKPYASLATDLTYRWRDAQFGRARDMRALGLLLLILILSVVSLDKLLRSRVFANARIPPA